MKAQIGVACRYRRVTFYHSLGRPTGGKIFPFLGILQTHSTGIRENVVKLEQARGRISVFPFLSPRLRGS